MWHVPEDNYTHPTTFIDMEKLYSNKELIRSNEKIKLKLEEKKISYDKKTPRFLWKDKINQFL